jgi:hypothetical protein
MNLLSMTPIDALSWLMIALAFATVIVRVLIWCDVEAAPEASHELGRVIDARFRETG